LLALAVECPEYVRMSHGRSGSGSVAVMRPSSPSRAFPTNCNGTANVLRSSCRRGQAKAGGRGSATAGRMRST
jgi:hypothetical protein